MVIVGVFLKSGSQVVHQSLGRNFHPPPGGIAIGEIIPPLVVGFPGDLAFLQGIGRYLPLVQHPVDFCSLRILPEVHPEAHIAVSFLHTEAIAVLQREKRVHEADVGINIRHRYGMRRDSENGRHLRCQVSLRIAVLGFTAIDDDVIDDSLRYGKADIGEKYLTVIREVARQYVTGIMRRLREHEYNPELMKLYIVGGGGCLIRHFGEYDPNRVMINDDIRVTAKGYEFLANLKLKKANAA